MLACWRLAVGKYEKSLLFIIKTLHCYKIRKPCTYNESTAAQRTIAWIWAKASQAALLMCDVKAYTDYECYAFWTKATHREVTRCNAGEHCQEHCTFITFIYKPSFGCCAFKNLLLLPNSSWPLHSAGQSHMVNIDLSLSESLFSLLI